MCLCVEPSHSHMPHTQTHSSELITSNWMFLFAIHLGSLCRFDTHECRQFYLIVQWTNVFLFRQLGSDHATIVWMWLIPSCSLQSQTRHYIRWVVLQRWIGKRERADLRDTNDFRIFFILLNYQGYANLICFLPRTNVRRWNQILIFVAHNHSTAAAHKFNCANCLVAFWRSIIESRRDIMAPIVWTGVMWHNRLLNLIAIIQFIIEYIISK